MKENNNIQLIRSLLERWYDADTTREEEAKLRKLLDETQDLPEELRKDKKLFMALSSPYLIGDATLLSVAESGFSAEAMPELPKKYAAKINTALEEEMSQDQVEPIELPANKRKSFTNTWWWAAACLVWILAIGSVISYLVSKENRNLQEYKHKGIFAQATQSDEIQQRDTLLISLPVTDETAYSSSTVESNGGTPQNRIIKRKNFAFTKKDKNNTTEIASTTHYQNHYLSDEEEKFLAMNNYRVIRDASEADDILNSIMTRIESTMEVESSRLAKIELEYDWEMSKLATIENIHPLNHQYHEEIN